MSELPPTSPCIAVCLMDPVSGFCRGCARTIAEIAGWLSFSVEERRHVLSRIAERKRVLPPEPSGRGRRDNPRRGRTTTEG